MTYQEPKYPLFVDLQGSLVVVIGGGSVAERKIKTLLDYGAQVRVIALETTSTISRWAHAKKIQLETRSFQPGDVSGAFLVICATNNREVNSEVFHEAKALNCLVNVVDVPELCNFFVPSIVKRGPLQIAISTSGAAPTVAKQLRRELEQTYGMEWSDYVSLLGELRTLVLERVPGKEPEHKPLFEALASSNLYERISSGEKISAEQAFQEIVTPLLKEGCSDITHDRESLETKTEKVSPS